MWQSVAADVPIPPDESNAVILAVIGLLTAVMVAGVTGFFSLLSAKANRTTAAPPPPVEMPSDGLGNLRERVAVLERRADDSDERDEVQDRRLDQTERHLDLDNPEWGAHDRH